MSLKCMKFIIRATGFSGTNGGNIIFRVDTLYWYLEVQTGRLSFSNGEMSFLAQTPSLYDGRNACSAIYVAGDFSSFSLVAFLPLCHISLTFLVGFFPSPAVFGERNTGSPAS